MQPWAGELANGELDDAGAVAIVEDHTVALDDRIEAMARWLAFSFEAPARYLDTSGDRDHDGIPDRLDPTELLACNAARGRERYGRCADRRAFTWEVRVTDELDFGALERVVVAEHMLQDATDVFIDRLGPSGIVSLPPGEVASAEAFYRVSGSLHEDPVPP